MNYRHTDRDVRVYGGECVDVIRNYVNDDGKIQEGKAQIVNDAYDFLSRLINSHHDQYHNVLKEDTDKIRNAPTLTENAKLYELCRSIDEFFRQLNHLIKIDEHLLPLPESKIENIKKRLEKDREIKMAVRCRCEGKCQNCDRGVDNIDESLSFCKTCHWCNQYLKRQKLLIAQEADKFFDAEQTEKEIKANGKKINPDRIDTKDKFFYIEASGHVDGNSHSSSSIKKLQELFINNTCGFSGKIIFKDRGANSNAKTYDIVAAYYSIDLDTPNPILRAIIRDSYDESSSSSSSKKRKQMTEYKLERIFRKTGDFIKLNFTSEELTTIDQNQREIYVDYTKIKERYEQISKIHNACGSPLEDFRRKEF